MMYLLYFFFFLSIRRPPRSTRTDTLFPYTTLFRSRVESGAGAGVIHFARRTNPPDRPPARVGLRNARCRTVAATEPGHLEALDLGPRPIRHVDRKSTRLNSSH